MRRPFIPLMIVVLLIVVGAGFYFLANKNKMAGSPAVTPGVTVVPTVSPTIGTLPENVSEGLELEVSAPADKTVINTSQVTVKGTTVPNAEVFINDQELKTNSKGAFSAVVRLDEGENPIIVMANDAEGNYAIVEISITYEIPAQ